MKDPVHLVWFKSMSERVKNRISMRYPPIVDWSHFTIQMDASAEQEEEYERERELKKREANENDSSIIEQEASRLPVPPTSD